MSFSKVSGIPPMRMPPLPPVKKPQVVVPSKILYLPPAKPQKEQKINIASGEDVYASFE
jgi:hypothetical protein